MLIEFNCLADVDWIAQMEADFAAVASMTAAVEIDPELLAWSEPEVDTSEHFEGVLRTIFPGQYEPKFRTVMPADRHNGVVLELICA